MSDSDGYSASSGYQLFSENSEGPVEGKTVKSPTFSAIEKNDFDDLVDANCANNPFFCSSSVAHRSGWLSTFGQGIAGTRQHSSEVLISSRKFRRRGVGAARHLPWVHHGRWQTTLKIMESANSASSWVAGLQVFHDVKHSEGP